jgi:hypothetical protein
MITYFIFINYANLSKNVHLLKHNLKKPNVYEFETNKNIAIFLAFRSV